MYVLKWGFHRRFKTATDLALGYGATGTNRFVGEKNAFRVLASGLDDC